MPNGKVLFGAGKYGRAALSFLKGKGELVSCFIDNDSTKWGSSIMGVPVIGLDEFIRTGATGSILLTCASKYRGVIMEQLLKAGVKEIEIFDERKIWSGIDRESIVSYSHAYDLEDVVLYHVLRDMESVFYIDVGSNDPWMYSVTKILYDHGGHGINIDPLPEMIELSKKERPRDINICAGVGANKGTAKLYCQGTLGSGLSTTVESNRAEIPSGREIDIVILTLRDICKEYVQTGTELHLLKIDVEGLEREVLLGADFSIYRPWIICIEATLPGSDIPCYDEWENILIENGYAFANQFGVNRYYLSKEHLDLKKKFLTREELLLNYRIFCTELLMY